MHSEKVGAFRANRTEKVGAFTANKTKKGGLYCGTYPYCFNMGVPPSVVNLSGNKFFCGTNFFKTPLYINIHILQRAGGSLVHGTWRTIWCYSVCLKEFN